MLRTAGWLAVLLAVVLAALAGPAAAEPRLALVIGNGDYEHSPKLRNPAADARLLQAELAKAGFEVTMQTDLGLQPLKRALVDFTDRVKQAGADATALVYYSGHGIQLRDANYLIPVDANLRRPVDADLEGVSLNGVLSYLEDARPHTTIVILDACRDNPLEASTRSGGTRGLARVFTGRGNYIAYSAEPGTTAEDGAGDNSPFAAALARYLTMPGLTIDQVFTKVRLEVNRETAGKQTPRADSGLLEDFFFVPATGAAPPAGATPPDTRTKPPETASICAGNQDPDTLLLQAQQAGTVEAYKELLRLCPEHPRRQQIQLASERAAEAAIWKVAQGENTVDAYQRYLIYYADGAFAAEARTRIAALEQADRLKAEQQQQALQQQQAQAQQQTLQQQALQQQAALQQQLQQQAPPPPPQRTLTSYPGYDLYGGDIATIPDTTIQACADQCTGNSQCIGYTFNVKLNVCILKNRWDTAYRNGDASSGIVEAEARGQPHPQANPEQMVSYNNVDFIGGDYNDVRGVPLETCRRMCSGDSACRAFTYVPRQRWCWLKNGNSRMRPKANVVSGQKQ